jgi:hypothetical protein
VVDRMMSLLQSLLGIGAKELTPGQMALRAVLTFVVTVAIIRLGNKRLFGKGTAFDLVVAIVIGSVMSRAITNSSGLFATWLAGLVLIALHWLLATLSYHLDWFGPLVKGSSDPARGRRARPPHRDAGGSRLPDGPRPGPACGGKRARSLARSARLSRTRRQYQRGSAPRWAAHP